MASHTVNDHKCSYADLDRKTARTQNKHGNHNIPHLSVTLVWAIFKIPCYVTIYFRPGAHIAKMLQLHTTIRDASRLENIWSRMLWQVMAYYLHSYSRRKYVYKRWPFTFVATNNLCRNWTYRKVSNIRRTLVGNKIVDHSDVVGASPVGAATTTSSFST